MGGATRQRLGEFELVRELGRGGMGVVYEAVQTSLGRHVALKVLGPGLGLTPQAVQRFRREAAAAAKLHHTNIVPVYATGEEHGTHFYAMELIEGPSLDRVLKQLREGDGPTAESPPPGGQTIAYAEGPGPAAEAAGLSTSSLSSGGQYFDSVARMVAGVADALDYAYKQGVIHRDIKPANLLLAPDGRLNLNDFGLARLLEQPGMTMTGEFLGTPAYMSPEQITGGRVPVDHRTDVYSLGATLYELLALRPPFAGTSRDQILAQILQKDPVPPRKVNAKVPVDLETICLKAMEKDPDRRYQTAGAVAEDLRRYINRFSITARRAGPIERVAKWIKRRPGMAAALTCAAIAVLMAVGFACRAFVAERERHAAELRRALDGAFVAAMGGDFAEAERLGEEAMRLGAPAGDVTILRGMVEVYRGNAAQATKELEVLRDRDPTMAARALLGWARFEAGDFSIAERTLGEIDQLSPVTPEDALFRGLLRSNLDDPRDAVADLEWAVARRPESIIARLVRAKVRLWLMLDTNDPVDGEPALDDLQACITLLPPGNVIALAESVSTNVVAAAAYDARGGPEDRDRARTCLATARRHDRALTESAQLQSALRAKIHFCNAIGDLDARTEWCERFWKKARAPWAANLYSFALYERGAIADARRVAEQALQPDADPFFAVQRSFLALEAGTRDEALAACRFAEKKNNGYGYALHATLLWRHLGDNGAAVAAAERILQGNGANLRLRNGWYRQVTSFLADKLTSDELLRRAGSSQLNHCEAHFFIGMVRLAEGDRSAAKKHFESTVKTGVLDYSEHMWSRIFLARMKAHPAWPPWIPLKK